MPIIAAITGAKLGVVSPEEDSVIVIVKLALPIFPAEFVVSHVTVFTPTGQKCNFKPPSAIQANYR